MVKRSTSIIIISFLLIVSVKGQDVVVPQTDFQLYLLARYPSCFYYDSFNELWMRTNCTEITTVDSLTIPGLNLADLTGMEYFTSLLFLDLRFSNIENLVLPPSLKYLNVRSSLRTVSSAVSFPSTLEYLDCSDNELSGMNLILPTSLKYLNISYNDIHTLPELPPNLDTLICGNQAWHATFYDLTSLPNLPNSLQYLDCSKNALTAIPTLPSSLKYLNCSDQNTADYQYFNDKTLGNLPSLPSSLEFLDCSSNKLTILPNLPLSLKYLSCGAQRWFVYELDNSQSTNFSLLYAGIDQLPALPSNLRSFYCGKNNLTSLPTLPANLVALACNDNGLTNLPSPLPLNLVTLWCNKTPIDCLPHLPSTLTTLSITGTNVSCLPNSGFYTVTPSLPLCSAVNNNNHCPSGPVISGTVFYDNNSNGIKDAGENFRPNVEAYTNAGFHAYSDINGYFEMSGDSGVNVLNIIAPPYYSVVPATNTFTFNSYDTVVLQLYPLQPQVNVDSVKITLTPLTTTRRGSASSCYISYENVGTTTVSTSITIRYNPSHLTYQTAGIPGVTNNAGVLTVPAFTLTPGDHGRFFISFIVQATATIGDTTYLSAQAVAGSSSMTDSSFSIISSSFDPNEKQATPKLTPQEAAAGTYINYLVRFQNTGNDTAINVVLTDVLNAQLDVNSFQMIDASHPAVIKRTANSLSFEFFNIQLPDSNVNELESHGYIRFRVKPLSSVSNGAIIPNTASIYFDYNSPVVTNTANTSVQAIVVPLSLLSFDLMQDGEKNALLRWNTATEINTHAFDIERSSNGYTFERVGTVAAAGRGDNSYSFKAAMPADLMYFRLKIIDADGRYSYSETRRLKRSKDGKDIFILVNPVRQTLTIDCRNSEWIGSKAMLTDQSGRKLMEFIIKGGVQQTDVSKLSAGVYYLRAGDEVIRFVVSR